MTWLIFLFCANFEVFCNEYIQLNVLTIDKFNTFNSHNNTLVERILICLFIIFINTQIETLYSFSKAAWLISESYQQKVNILMGLESTDIVELVRQKHSGTGEIKFWFHGPYSILIFILLIYSAASSLSCVMQDLSSRHMDLVVTGPGLSCSTACGILVPQLGIKPASPALQGRFLTTGPLGKSPYS